MTIPSSCLLAQHRASGRQYKDCYSIALPAKYKLLKGTGSKLELSVSEVATSLFHCKVFKNLELPLLKLAFRWPDDWAGNLELINYKKFKYGVGDKVLLWTVIGRRPNEILMEWEANGNIKGTTWFYLPKENCIFFGSSIELHTGQDDFQIISSCY